MDMMNAFFEKFKDLPSGIREKLAQGILEREEEIIQHERMLSVMKATSAFLEAKIPKERIIVLLQKHWDLRRSEAEKALWQAENRVKRG